MKNRRYEHRCGFGQVEVLVVISSIVLLCTIGFPALLSAREAARQRTSLSNLQKLGDAMNGHVATFGFLPGNGGPSTATVPTPDARTLNPNDADEPYEWGYGDPRLAGKKQPGSWAYALLPYLGFQKSFVERDQAVVVPYYYTPGRRPAVAEVAIEGSDPIYPGWMCLPDGLNPWGKTDYAGNDQILRGGAGNVMRPDQIRDGLSVSIVIGEKAMDARAAGKGGWYWDEPLILGGAGGTGRKGNRILRDGPIHEEAADNWGSPNEYGAAFLFADGSARTLGYSTDGAIMTTLISPDDGTELSEDFWQKIDHTDAGKSTSKPAQETAIP